MGKKTKQKSLTWNAFLSSLKTLTTIIFPLITYPYVTRVLSVENIGRINFGQSIVSYFTLIAALGINTFAIRNGSQIREDSQKLNQFANRMFTINVISTGISCLLLVLLLLMPTKVAEYRTIILIQGITVALSPLAVDWLYTLNEDFGYITWRSFCVHLMSLILMFAFVKKESDVYLYVALTTMSASLGNLFNFWHSRRYVRLHITRDTHWKEYRSSILLFFVNSIATTIYMNSDTTILGLMKDDYSVGLYSVAVKIYSIVKLVFNAIISSVIPRLAYLKKNDETEFEALIRNMIELAAFFSIPAATGLIILRKDIILLISGESYVEAGTTLAVLAPAIFFAVIGNILANGLLICLGREKFVVKATIVSAISNAALNFVFIPFFSQNGAAMTTLTAEIIVVIMSLYYSRDYLSKVIFASEFRNPIIGSLTMLLAAYAAKAFVAQMNFLLRMGIIVFLCVFCYFAVMLMMRDKVLGSLLNALKKKIGK